MVGELSSHHATFIPVADFVFSEILWVSAALPSVVEQRGGLPVLLALDRRLLDEVTDVPDVVRRFGVNVARA